MTVLNPAGERAGDRSRAAGRERLAWRIPVGLPVRSGRESQVGS